MQHELRRFTSTFWLGTYLIRMVVPPNRLLAKMDQWKEFFLRGDVSPFSLFIGLLAKVDQRHETGGVSSFWKCLNY